MGNLLYLHPGWRADADFGLMYLSDQQEKELLEIGCGNGAALGRLVRLGWVGCGMDTDPQAVAQARLSGLQVECGTLEDLGYDAERFDVVIISHVLEHTGEPENLLREIRRVLKKGGKVVCATPNLLAFGHTLFRESWLNLDPPRHLILHNPNSLTRLLVETGYDISKLWTTCRYANGVWTAYWARKSGCVFEVGREGSVFRRITGRFVQLVEWVAICYWRMRGEDLCVVAQRPIDS